MLDVDQIARFRGRNLVGSDGSKIGQIQDIYLDDDTGRPEWVSVNTGLFGSKSTFVPVHQAQPEGEDLRVPFTKEQVKDAPNIDADQHLSVDEERRLYSHYGMDHTSSATEAVGEARPTAVGDTSGPTADDAMTRSEEELDVDTQRRPVGRARLRKQVVTDHVQTTVPVEREELRVVHEPITDANVDQAMSGPELSEDEHEVTLSEEEVVVSKRTVPKERVRLEKDTVVEDRDVDVDLRREEIDTDARERG